MFKILMNNNCYIYILLIIIVLLRLTHENLRINDLLKILNNNLTNYEY